MFAGVLKATLAVILAVWLATTMSRLLPTLGTAVPARAYASCTELRADFPHGLAATQLVADRHSATPRTAPRVHPDGYVLNLALDRDHDGLACAGPSRERTTRG